MNEIVKNLAALIKVKTLVTFILVVASTVMALAGQIDPGQYWNAVLIVIGFYFGTQKLKE